MTTGSGRGHWASRASHDLLDAYLARARHDTEPAEIVALPLEERAKLLVDVLRMRREHGGYGPGPFFALERVEGAILDARGDLPLAELCGALHELGAVQGICGYHWQGAWKQAQRRMKKHGIEPALHDALRAMQPAMHAHASDKNAREEIDLVLWFESHLPIDLRADATAVIKRDLRAMEPATRKTWESLLALAQRNDRAEPRDAWLARARTSLDAIGSEVVVARVRGWLTAVASEESPRLAPGGVDALRGLVFFTTLFDDPSCDAAIETLAARPWQRGKAWSPRHDRFVGALVYALAQRRSAQLRPLAEALRPRFGKTTARYAFDNALGPMGGPA